MKYIKRKKQFTLFEEKYPEANTFENMCTYVVYKVFHHSDFLQVGVAARCLVGAGADGIDGRSVVRVDAVRSRDHPVGVNQRTTAD